MKYVINSFEIFMYYSCWISVIIWSLCSYFASQIEIFTKNPYLRLSLGDLAPGWTFLGREKDVSDIEWSCWKFYIQASWPYLIMQFVVSEFLRQTNKETLKYWYICSSIIFVSLSMGIKQLIVIVIQPIIYFSLIICGFKKISVWVISLILLLTYNTLKYKHFFWQFLDDGSSQEEKVFLLLFSMAWIELRCISYCLDYIERLQSMESEKKSDSVLQNFTNMFSYVLYLPLLYLGPIILYEDFKKSFECNGDKAWNRIKSFTVDIILYLTYAFLLELAFHFIYFHAMHNEMELIEQLPTLALAGGGLWMGFEFHTKYVISYGSTTAFARLDNMETPPTPRCIARVHVYSQMWRYFDVGLYKFLVKYIYKPSYASMCQCMNVSKILYKLIASFCTFAFIFLWHGTAMNIFVWSVLNYTGILLEQTAKYLSTKEWYHNFKKNVLRTEAMEVRFTAALCAPLLTISAISNFYLFGGYEVGNVYMSLLKWPAPHNLMFVLFATYCCSHVSISLLDVPSRTDVKRNKVKVN